MITPAPPPQDKDVEEKTEALAQEADKIRKEYEEKLKNLQDMFEKEQSSKQELQDELDKLEKEYSAKLDHVQQEYDHMTEAEKIVNDFEKQDDSKDVSKEVAPGEKGSESVPETSNEVGIDFMSYSSVGSMGVKRERQIFGINFVTESIGYTCLERSVYNLKRLA